MKFASSGSKCTWKDLSNTTKNFRLSNKLRDWNLRTRDRWETLKAAASLKVAYLHFLSCQNIFHCKVPNTLQLEELETDFHRLVMASVSGFHEEVTIWSFLKPSRSRRALGKLLPLPAAPSSCKLWQQQQLMKLPNLCILVGTTGSSKSYQWNNSRLV